MGYRDDLISDLRESGKWQTMTTEMQQICESLDDQAAAVMMVLRDNEELKVAARRIALSNSKSEEAQSTAQQILTEGLVNLSELFNGGLLNLGSPPKLTVLGRLLAQVFNEAEKNGFSLSEALDQLGQISFEGAMLVRLLAKARSEEA
jgi:hypothetical protein